ncbi:MAG: hypothetical protein ACJA2K_002180 [Thalassolituus sp.]|jgi:hypothetical protein
MNEAYKIELHNGKKICGEVEFSLNLEKSSVRIRYTDTEGRKGEFSGHDFFYVLADIRKIYSDIGYKLLCKGALSNVFTGGLTSESSFGELAYQIDEKTGSKAVVNVFDKISQDEITNIDSFEMQKEKRRSIIKKFATR